MNDSSKRRANIFNGQVSNNSKIEVSKERIDF
jgi:hypothetical protein